jgi:ABC-type sulfate transport system permease component
MRRLTFVLACLAAGYVAGALAGAGAVEILSGNSHDKSQEMTMTGAFVTGPIGAVIGAVIGWVVSRKK